MNISRRGFGKLLSAAAMLRFLPVAGLAFLTGCSWESDIETLVPTMLTALGNIMSMIKSAGVNLPGNVLTWVGTITTAGGDLVAAVKSYVAGASGSTIAAIDDALTTFLNGFQNLIALLPPLPALVINLVGAGFEIILGAIQNAMNNVPMPAPASASLPRAAAKLKAIGGMELKGAGTTLSRKIDVSRFVHHISSTSEKLAHVVTNKFRHDWNATEPKQYHV